MGVLEGVRYWRPLRISETTSQIEVQRPRIVLKMWNALSVIHIAKKKGFVNDE